MKILSGFSASQNVNLKSNQASSLRPAFKANLVIKPVGIENVSLIKEFRHLTNGLEGIVELVQIKGSKNLDIYYHGVNGKGFSKKSGLIEADLLPDKANAKKPFEAVVSKILDEISVLFDNNSAPQKKQLDNVGKRLVA